MNARLRFAVVLVSLCAWVVVGGVKARARDEPAALAASGAGQAAELSLAQAEESLSRAEGLPWVRSRKDWEEDWRRYRVKELEAAFRVAITRDPARAYQGMGRCQMLLGRYGDAARSFRKWLKAEPRSGAAAAGLRRAQQLGTIAQAAVRPLPKGSIVLQVAAMRADGREWWLALSARLEPKKPWTDHDFYKDARLRLLRETSQGLQQVWRSDELRVRIGPGPGWTNDLRMYVLSEKPPKVLVVEAFYGAGWSPSHLDAFAWQAGRLVAVPVLEGETAQASGFDSEEPPWIRDLRNDGQHEVETFCRVGKELAIANMVLWPSIYAYEGGGYVLADRRFPEEYTEVGDEIQQRLREHPDNYELLKYLGIYHEIAGEAEAALDAYRRALSALDACTHDSAEEKARQAADIRARIQRLGQ